MANNCLSNVKLIQEDEYIGESLKTINDNFSNLKESAGSLEQKLDPIKSIRTFFYYGPNTPNTTGDTSGMSLQTGQASYPSVQTIETFVNNANQLNLIPISEVGDQAYVIYQKTGWYIQADNHPRSGSGQVQFSGTQKYNVWITRSIGICFAPGTAIQTPRGDISIEELKVGDLVYSYHPETKEKKAAKVVKVFKDKLENAKEISPLLQIKHENGELLVTADHWVYVGEKDCLFKAAKQLTTNDSLVLDNNQKSKILSINQNFDHEYVYNINVEKYHNFIANGVLTGDFQTNDLVALNSNSKVQVEPDSVATPRGFIKISDLKIGDTVYGYNTETLDLSEQKIKRAESKTETCIKLVHERGELILNEEQKVLLDQKYVSAKELSIGDLLTILEDTDLYTPYYSVESKILDIQKNIKQQVYHLEVSNTNNYIFNSVYIHNRGGPRIFGGGGRGAGNWETRTRTVTEWVGYSWSTNIEDSYSYYAPIFVIYCLTFNGTAYVVDSGFPKFNRAITNTTSLWNNPQNWTTY